MTEEERPVHVVVDCSTGESTETPVSDEEWAAIKQGEVDNTAAQEAQQKADEELKNQVLQRNDPLLTALAQRTGIL